MYKYIRTETRELTPSECEQMLKFNTHPGQRSLNNKKARLYADAIVDGSMLPSSVAVALMHDGSTVIMNGQHVLTGGALSGKNHLFQISYYQCETKDDAWQLYAKFDTHQTRSNRQIMKGARGLFNDPRLQEVPLSVLGLCGTALMALAGGQSDPVFTNSGVIDKTIQPRLVEENAEDVLYVAEFADKRHMMRAGVVMAIIAISRKGNGRANEFLKKIADGVGFTSKMDPAYRLREHLLEGVLQADLSNSSRHRMYYSLCVSWWNAWISGEKRSSVKLGAMERIPKVLTMQKAA